MKDNFDENLNKAATNIEVIYNFLNNLQSNDVVKYNEQNIGQLKTELSSGENINEIVVKLEEIIGNELFYSDIPLLHLAVKANDFKAVTALLELKANIDVRDDKREATALHRAAQNGQLEMIKFLVESNADIHAKDKRGLTMLHYAADNGHSSAVQLFLNFGINIETKDSYNETALHYAVDSKHMKTAEFLLNNKADIESKNQDGRTPMLYALLDKHDEMIRFLLKHNADINSEDFYNDAFLITAATNNHLDLVELLLKNKADINVRGFDNFTALHRAVAKGHLEIAKHLLENNAKVNQNTNGQETELHYAVFTGHLAMVKLLLKHHANINLKNNHGQAPLHMAVAREYEEIVKFLLVNKADINMITANANTPLSIAAMQGCFTIAKLLIDKNAEIDVKNSQKPLVLALEGTKKDNNHAKIVETILEVKPKMALTRFELPNGETVCTFEWAAKSGCDKVIDMIFATSPKLISTNGLNALSCAAWEGHVSTTTKLLSKLFEVKDLSAITNVILLKGNIRFSDGKDQVIFKSTFCNIAADFIVQNFFKSALLSVNHNKNFMSMLKICQKVDKKLLIDIFNEDNINYPPYAFENMKQYITANFFVLKRVAHTINKDAPIISLVKYTDLMSHMLDFIDEGSLSDAEYDAPLVAKQTGFFNECIVQ